MTANRHDGYIDSRSDYAQRLLAKRAELDRQVAYGNVTLDEAEELLGEWHQLNRPDRHHSSRDA